MVYEQPFSPDGIANAEPGAVVPMSTSLNPGHPPSGTCLLTRKPASWQISFESCKGLVVRVPVGSAAVEGRTVECSERPVLLDAFHEIRVGDEEPPESDGVGMFILDSLRGARRCVRCG
jgi:hypothetical protein